MAGKIDLTKPLRFIGGPLDGRMIIPAAGLCHQVVVMPKVSYRFVADGVVPVEPEEFRMFRYTRRDWFGVHFMAEETLSQEQIVRALMANYRPPEE